MDRSGLRNRIFDSEHLSLDISLSGGLPVKNTNRARQGMPKIYLTGELGPQLNWTISENASHIWSAHLPSRAAINVRGKYIGWVTEPYVRYNYHTPVAEGNLRIKCDVGVLYGSQPYNQTYYGVDPAYVTASRPAYQARSGLHSAYMKARIRYPVRKNVELFSSLQLRSLSVGVVKDSPLVKSRVYSTVALGVVWIFATSDETVSTDE
jgi:outer membrane scaffolding protein for murein synthesis (MipA/OmpV family)